MQPLIPEFHNVVATVQIQCDCALDIGHIRAILPYTSYDKKKFAAITIRLHNPQCTCLLFASGKLVITGARTSEQALLTAYCIRDILQEVYAFSTFHVTEFKIQNMVAHVDLHLLPTQTLNLQQFYQTHNAEVTYQPRMFPGLIFRPRHTHIVFLCFASGKIVITGGFSEDEITETWEHNRPTITSFIISFEN